MCRSLKFGRSELYAVKPVVELNSVLTTELLCRGCSRSSRRRKRRAAVGRKRLRQHPGSGGVAAAVVDAMSQLRAESAGDGEMLASLDRIQVVLEGRTESLPASDQRSDNSTADGEPAAATG